MLIHSKILLEDFGNMSLVYLLLLIFGPQFTVQSTRYDGHQVLRVFTSSVDKNEEIKNIIDKYALDVWRRNWHDKSVEIQVNPDILPFVTRELHSKNVLFSRWIPDIQSVIDKQDLSNKDIDKDIKKTFHHGIQGFSLSKYNKFDQITAFILNLKVKSFYGPSGEEIVVDYKEAGLTYEGNPIHLLKIYKPGITKKAIFIEGGIHAREWISPAFVLYFINELVNNPSRSTEIEDLVEAYDWYIIPVLNPDGYIYTQTNDRLWRKNRRPILNEKDSTKSKRAHDHQRCYGVDINRNFGYMWNPTTSKDHGASSISCSLIYGGSHPFSERESTVVKRIVEDVKIDFISYLSFHSYGQYWMYPWAFTSDYPPDVEDLDTGAQIAREAIGQRYNTNYTIGSVFNVLYAATGVSIDYAKGDAGIKYSYTCELRGKDHYGFLLPKAQIIPTCKETMDAMLAVVNFLKTAPQT